MQVPYADPLEQWINCQRCGAALHRICALYHREVAGDSPVVLCPGGECQVARAKKSDPDWIGLKATKLKRTPLSIHLEDAVAGIAKRVSIRIVSNVKRVQVLPEELEQRYPDVAGVKDQLAYQQKMLMGFQTGLDGFDVAFFAMQVLWGFLLN